MGVDDGVDDAEDELWVWVGSVCDLSTPAPRSAHRVGFTDRNSAVDGYPFEISLPA